MRKLPRKRTIAAVILICGVILLALMALNFIRHRLKYATTDAVFIRTDSLANLGFDGVGGRITGMGKYEGETVAAGESLARIDDQQFRLEVERLTAELAEAQNELAMRRLTRTRLARETKLNMGIADDEVTRLQAEKAAIEAKGASVTAEVAQLERDRDRYAALIEAKAVALRKVEDVDTELSARSEEQAALGKQAAALAAASSAASKKVKLADNNQLLVKEAEQAIAAQVQKVAALAASLDKARDRLAKCELKSPIDGRVARRFASPGDVLAPGQAVYALVDPQDVYAVALLEENKLKGVAAGSQVDMTLDAYPDQKFSGVVREVMPASAATFALVPRDISAGEFTKVAQRIPVRIAITAGNLALLRVGLGGEVEIKRQL
jgi:membrane fusion protein (multidrug efflux system)